MGAQAFDTEKRLNGFFFLPEDCVLIGEDEGGAEHPHYDPRVHLPVDEDMARSIMVNGLQHPIKVKKDPKTGRPIVTKGRQRVKAARLVNKWLAEAGRDPILLAATVESRGTTVGEEMAGALAENAHRQADNALVVSEKAAHYIKHNGDSEESLNLLCVSLAVTRQRLDKLLALREAHPRLKQAIIDKHLGVEAALALAVLPIDEQVPVLEDLQREAEENDTKVSAERAREEVRTRTGKSSAPSKATLKRVVNEAKKAMEAGEETINPDVLAALEWVLGKRKSQTIKGLSALLKAKKDEGKDAA